MTKYSFKTAIPTASKSRGLSFDKDLYFASNTYIYKYSQDVYGVVATVDGIIKDFYFYNEKFYVLSDSHLIISFNGRNIASMKKGGDCVIATDDYIIVNDNNELEVWHNPKEYKVCMFELYQRNSEHTGRITTIYVYDNYIFTGSEDHTVRMLNLKTNKSRKVQTVKSRPVGIDKIGDFLIITCFEGQIYKLKMVGEEFEFIKREQRDGQILCNSVYGDLYATAVLKENKNHIEIIKDEAVIYTVEIEGEIREIRLNKHLMAIKNSEFVGIYNLKNDLFNLELVMPKIVTFDTDKEIIAVGCADKKVRLYEDSKITSTLWDEKSTHPIRDVFIVKNFILSLAIDGHVSLFDIKNGTCFRSFKVPIKISSSIICKDGILLFLGDSDTCSIRIIDLQRSREIDNLTGHEAIIKHLQYYKGVLYSLSLDNELRKWDYLKGTSEVLQLDKTVLSLRVAHNQLAVSFVNEINFYDLDLIYLNSFDYSIKNRKRNELYLHEKGAEQIEFSLDGCFVLLAGEYNNLYLCDSSNGEVEQMLQVSFNKSWENYDGRFYKRKKENFDKSQIIETLKMKHSLDHHKIYLQTREGIIVFSRQLTEFHPLDLDVETTPNAITRYLEDKEYLKGLLGALRLGELELIQEVMFAIPKDNVEFVVKHIPHNLVPLLRDTMLKCIQEGHCLVTVYFWLKHVLFYHADSNSSNSGLEVFKKRGEEIYKAGLENIFMMKRLKRDNK